MSAANYGYSGPGPFRLTRDGREILIGTEQECWTWIHRHSIYSVSWALRYEGYTITPYRIEESGQ